MDKRHHPNFIQAFTGHYSDNFVPSKFFLWTAVSLVAAVLERKVWTTRKKGLHFYPNMYIFLVSRPGIGKSSAMKPASKLIQKMNESFGTYVRMLPDKVTEPKLFDLLGEQEYFQYKNTQIAHTSAYFFASEGSTCFDDPYGGFTQTMTALYDCNDMSKATVSRKNEVKVVNPCVNILSGLTFVALAKILHEEGIMGGFASRVTYVIQDEVMHRESVWEDGDSEIKNADVESYMNLVQDLHSIHKMVGPFTPTPEYRALYNDWFPKYDLSLQVETNPKLQSLKVRRATAMMKLPMILSAAESSSRVLEARHWHMAITMMNAVEDKLPTMLREGQAAQPQGQASTTATIMKIFTESATVSRRTMVQAFTRSSRDAEEGLRTVSQLITAGDIIEKGDTLTFVGKPDDYL